MEDLGMLTADCVVISCCCQCLILQTLIFVFLKLPCKLAKKTREYAKKKLQERKRDHEVINREMDSYKDYEPFWIHENSCRIQLEEGEFGDASHSFGDCMEEVEKVMEEISQRGDFAFGSFWGRKGPWGIPTIMTKDDSVERYQIIEIVNNSFGYSIFNHTVMITMCLDMWLKFWLYLGSRIKSFHYQFASPF